MADASGTIDIQKLISYSDDLVEVLKDKRDVNHRTHCLQHSDALVEVLKDKRDVNHLTHCLQHSDALRSSSDAHFAEAQNLLRDYEKKVDACKKKTEEAKSEVVADEKLDLLQRELDEGIDWEHLLMEELRDINSKIDDLERQRVAALEKKKMLKKQKQDEFRAQRKLSMYASVTNIIPNLDDQSRILGYIVDRDTKAVQTFEIDAEKMTSYETSDSIWKMITP